MNISSYQEQAYFALGEHKDARDRICNWIIGLGEEVGEVGGVVKHHLYGKEPIDLPRLVKEVGDVMWYLQALCNVYGISMEACAKMNLAKLEHRHEGVLFSYERSAERHVLEREFSKTWKFDELLEEAINYEVADDDSADWARQSRKINAR
jgi:NTP pyrophosphatase (non-canonical NTP hydrolase)